MTHPHFKDFLAQQNADVSCWATSENEKDRLQDLRAFMVWAYELNQQSAASHGFGIDKPLRNAKTVQKTLDFQAATTPLQACSS